MSNKSINELVELVKEKTQEFEDVRHELGELRSELQNAVSEATKAIGSLNTTLGLSEGVRMTPVASEDHSTTVEPDEIVEDDSEPVTVEKVSSTEDDSEESSENEPEEKPTPKRRGRKPKQAEEKMVEEPRTGTMKPVEEVDPKIDPVEPVEIAEENTEAEEEKELIELEAEQAGDDLESVNDDAEDLEEQDAEIAQEKETENVKPAKIDMDEFFSDFGNIDFDDDDPSVKSVDDIEDITF